jgi:hypothetical protein
MPRPCGPCQDKQRNELDLRLLEMEISGETIASISRETGYSEDSLRRHKANHVIKQLGDVRALMIEARELARAEALEEAKENELETLKDGLKDTIKADIANRLELCQTPFDQLKILRERAATLLDQAESSQDMKSAGTFLKELREQIRLMAELEGKLQSQPQITIITSPQWIELKSLIISTLKPYPDAYEALIDALP